MTGKIFRSCFLVGLAMMVLCTALFLVVMTNKHEQTVYAEMRQEMCYVRHGLEQSGNAEAAPQSEAERLREAQTAESVGHARAVAGRPAIYI